MRPQSITVPLTQGKQTIIDAEDYVRVSQFKWHAQRDYQTWYASRTARREDGAEYTIWMHRFIMDASPDTYIDHRNGDGLDNRRSNLRFATNAQNAANRRVRSDNTSGYKGVSFHRRWNRWQAYINRDGKRTALGYFSSAEDAARAYDAAARMLHGDFCRLNFPD